MTVRTERTVFTHSVKQIVKPEIGEVKDCFEVSELLSHRIYVP